MRLTPVPKRELKNVGEAIWHAVEVMEKEFGAQLTHDSGHDRREGRKPATWIFTFPRFGDAQVALRMNKTKLSLYLRSRTVDGKPLEPLLPDGAELDKPQYTNSESGVAASLMGPHAPFLNPAPSNPLLLVDATDADITELLRVYLGAGAVTAPAVAGTPQSTGAPAAPNSSRRPVTAAELHARLDRQSEVGRQGEEVARRFEVKRLQDLRCPDPENWVKLVALTDIGCGYDIESTWPGHERCIEVKSSTQAHADIFITDNERKVLASLGPKAWLYRVHLRADGSGDVVLQLPDPVRALPEVAFIPVAFRVDGDALARVASSLSRCTP